MLSFFLRISSAGYVFFYFFLFIYLFIYYERLSMYTHIGMKICNFDIILNSGRYVSL